MLFLSDQATPEVVTETQEYKQKAGVQPHWRSFENTTNSGSLGNSHYANKFDLNVPSEWILEYIRIS